MEIRGIVQKLRNYEIKIRKAINSQMRGDFHSIFKGSGVEFDDVRSYQYGDDIRAINWNVTAKGHGTFVNTYKEEKEQSIFFLLDVSASQDIGTAGKKKLDIAREICGVLTLSAIKEQSEVGVICFSDKKEKYIKPAKGIKQAYKIISDIFSLQPESIKTNLNNAFLYALNALKKKSIVIIISDFIDDNYLDNLRALARRHDVVAIHTYELREAKFPKLGIIPLYDKEKQRTVWINTSAPGFRQEVISIFDKNKQDLMEFCKKYEINYLPVDTQKDYVPELIRLFKVRNLRSKTKTA